MRSPDPIEKQLDGLFPDPQTTPPSPAAERAITERLVGSLTPVRPIPSRAAIVAGFLAVFAVVSAAIIAVVGTNGAANMTLPQLAGVLAAVFVAALLAASSLSCEMSPGDRRLIHPGAMTAGVLSVLFVLLAAVFPWQSGPAYGWHCFRSGFLFSLPAVALVLVVVRKGAPLAWGAVGAMAGLLGGLVGMTAIHVGCTLLNAPHALTGHFTIPLAGAVVGYLAGKTLPYVVRAGADD